MNCCLLCRVGLLFVFITVIFCIYRFVYKICLNFELQTCSKILENIKKYPSWHIRKKRLGKPAHIYTLVVNFWPFYWKKCVCQSSNWFSLIINILFTHNLTVEHWHLNFPSIYLLSKEILKHLSTIILLGFV